MSSFLALKKNLNVFLSSIHNRHSENITQNDTFMLDHTSVIHTS